MYKLSAMILIIFLQFLVSGCAGSYSLDEGTPEAKFSISSYSDPSDTYFRNVIGWTFKNGKCESNPNGTSLGRDMHKTEVGVIEEVSIEANKNFVVTVFYIDARWAQNRQCGVTAEFTPEEFHKYKAKLFVNQDVTGCKLGIFDETNGGEERVNFTLPEYQCLSGDFRKLKNGRSLWTNHSVQFVDQPAKNK